MKVEFIPYKGYDRIKPFTKLQLNYICLFSQINLILSLYILIPVNVIGDNHRLKLTAKYLYILTPYLRHAITFDSVLLMLLILQLFYFFIWKRFILS